MRPSIKNAIKLPIKQKPRKGERGYILIEIMLVIVAIGLMIVAGVPLYKSYQLRYADKITEKRMEAIARAFSNYIQMHFRLPCPANPGATTTPFGVQRGADACDTAGEITNARGIIPYRTLGIPEEYARDGYGNFFTYLVSPDFTTDTMLATAPNLVNARYRYIVSDESIALRPLAQFCAPLTDSGTDLIVTNQNNDRMFGTGALRDTTNITPPASSPNNANSTDRENLVTGVAMAIISHGQNGFGAYQGNGNQLTPNAGSPEEDTNNATFTTNAVTDPNRTIQIHADFGAGGYDDIVKFYTQDQIYGYAGGGSCEHL